MFRPIRIRAGFAQFCPRNTPSVIVDNIPSSTVVQRVTAHRACITGFYVDRRKPPRLVAVGHVLLLWVESGHRLGDRHGSGSAGLSAAGENAAAARLAAQAFGPPRAFSLPRPRLSR